ncbi:MAG TPA: methyltransferase domain-containing protein [Candidatus Acidoferrales bacterium]|nr:methyltransferase domain-containing protein [Candidatus Acidoferrales bacterium]
MAREWDSAAYHRLSDPQFGWALKVLDRLDALNLPDHAHILDAGCGTGRVTAELLRKFPQCRVTAVDASENMVRQAKLTLEHFGDRVQIEKRDLLEIACSNAFDLVFSTAVFHWIKDHDRLFAVLLHALKPGGFMAAQCGGGPNLKKVRDRAQKLIELDPFRKYFEDWQKVWEYPGPELTAARLRRAGFEDVITALEAAPVTFSEAEQYHEFLRTVILHPYLERLPEPLKSELINEMVRQSAQEQPPFVLDYWRLNMRAHKALH